MAAPERSGAGENGNYEHTGFSFSSVGKKGGTGGHRKGFWVEGSLLSSTTSSLLDDPARVNTAFITISRLGT